ncbi:MAG: hypothetical protein HC909_00310 [Blastochloris sp.]|nr:hypothetical protein [Blastochloris sp.]
MTTKRLFLPPNARWLGVFIGLLALTPTLLPTPVLAQPTDAGGKLAELDSQLTRITTQFDDAYAVTERTADGRLSTSLFSLDGFGLASQETDLVAGKLAIRGLGFAGEEVDLGVDAPTTEWANLQLYSAWLDQRAKAAGPLERSDWEWQDGFYRPHTATAAKGGSVQHGAVLEGRIQAVNSRFGAIEAYAVRERVPAEPKAGANTDFATFTTRLIDQSTGRPLGILRWFANSRVLVWDLPGLTSGYVDEQRLGQPFPFEPGLGWSTLQAFGFLQMHTAIQIERLGNQAKNDPGCDGLHWLDNTIFRPCCDDHDRCYERNGCTAGSWWVFGASWSCIRCNIAVVFCFLTGGGGGGGGV